MDKRSLKAVAADSEVYIEYELGYELPFPYTDSIENDIAECLKKEQNLPITLPEKMTIVIGPGEYNYEAEEEVDTDFFEGNKSVHSWTMWGSFSAYADMNTESFNGDFTVTGHWDESDDVVIADTLVITKLEKSVE